MLLFLYIVYIVNDFMLLKEVCYVIDVYIFIVDW